MKNGFKARVQFASFISTIDLALGITISQSLTALAPISFCLGNVTHFFQANVDLRFRNLSAHNSHNPPFRRTLAWTFHSISASLNLTASRGSFHLEFLYSILYMSKQMDGIGCNSILLFMTRAFPLAILQICGAMRFLGTRPSEHFSRRLGFLPQFHQLHLVRNSCFERSRFLWRTCSV